ncbi:MAG: electron transfer flavoprotein subunit alpha/FixB family protein [Pseudomonadota bacterium]
MAGIWVISDQPERAWELLSQARQLAAQWQREVTAFVAGGEEIGQEAIARGADRVGLIAVPQDTTWEQYVPVLFHEAKTSGPELILVAATRRGKDLAGQLAALLDRPCVSDCLSMVMDGPGRIVVERLIYGGLAVKKMICDSFPLLFTIPARSYEALPPEAGRQGEIRVLEPSSSGAVKVTQRTPRESRIGNLQEADIVIGVGRGFSEQDEVRLAEDLAEVLEAEIACSRPIAEFFKWLPEDRYLGISGQVIKPQLYLAAGISGQAQHVYGIRDSKIIVAVNKDENAPIFRVADYFIVGDLKIVLPELTRAAAAVKQSS